ncbi:BTAD domain-containing putative transcriptional regulator [Streptomyces sp. DH24]|uniref:AfsR/SARP family transcriptional regulator n=1 Tax=Streptomyces sp. DH24 TaxID=3040123 RepID=UPI0024410BFC|nr:BTAD domain-containing putative transcriptional regulator [Streptomyces sp. DH24]MDG9716407.1 tetratricopeptide repeat protein [Streptomyces sp. DH24]
MVDLLALGPLELWHDGRRHALGSRKQRCVLAVLVHARGEPVGVETLLDRLWDGEPPPTAVDTLQSYVSRLRKRLQQAVGDDLARIDRPSSGLYQLRAAPEHIDLLRFQGLRKDASAAASRGDRTAAVAMLRTAESLWRGEPLPEFTDSAWAQSVRARLVEDHRRVREERIGLELELGRHADLVGELRELASQNPYAQRVIGSLMLALYRSGRHDEALEVYRDTHTGLLDSQGIEPGSELQELHLRMLEQDPALLRPEPVPTATTPTPEPRNCLPRDIRDFTGRAAELRILLTTADHTAPTALPVTVVHGMPGIGKTALALHAAHRLREAYPDGQFYVDLRGYGGPRPLDPAEALATLLQSAGVTGELPGTLDERAARWREWTARHRALVVLDNARDAAQVAPLLPGAPTCRAIVTTRGRLAGLDGAALLPVEALSRAEAAALFTRIVGAARLSGAHEVLKRIVDVCGCHPLALNLLASRFRHRHSWDLQHLLDRLVRAADPLHEFDELMSAVFHFSYAELSPRAQQLFRRLALHTGPDITLPAAAALAGPDHEGEPGLLEKCVEELLDSSLLEEPVRGRYRLHDLTRAFGLQVGRNTDTEEVRRAATGRLVAHHLTTAHRADRLAHPHRRPLPPTPQTRSRYALTFSDKDEATVWLTVERPNLLAAARTAAAGHPAYAALFPRVLARTLKLWGALDVAAELFDAALPVLRARGDRSALAGTLTDRADLLAQLNHGEALRCATEALALYRDLGDAGGRADALLQSGRAHLAGGHGGRAMQDLEQSLTLYREVGDRAGEAECLNVQGAALVYAGRHDEAQRRVRLMQEIHEALPNPYGVARALNNRGELLCAQGRFEEARACYERSQVLMRQHGGRYDLAILDTNLGVVHQATGRTEQALAFFQRALAAHRASGDALGVADVLISMGTAYARSGRRGEALLHLTMAERVAADIDNPYERLRALLAMADVQRESGRLDAAHKGCGEALGVARSIDFPMGCADALAGLAWTAHVSGRPEQARRYAVEAADLYRRLGAGAEADKLLPLVTPREAAGP